MAGNPWDQDEIVTPAPTAPGAAAVPATQPGAVAAPAMAEAPQGSPVAPVRPGATANGVTAGQPSTATAPLAATKNPWDDDEIVSPAQAGGAPPAKAPTEPPKPQRSFVDELGHQAGLTARAGVNALVSLPAMAVDAVAAPINAGLDYVAGKGNGYRIPNQAQAVNNFMDSVGVAKPENATERVVQDATTAVAGAGATMALGKHLISTGGPLAAAAGKMLTQGPAMQVASAATSGAAAGGVREAGGGEGAQLAAGVAGALAPGLLPAAGVGAVRGALRGGEAGRQQVENTIKTFADAAGTTPTLGQATGSRALQAAETAFTNTVGSSSIMVRRAENQAKALGDSVQKLTNALAPEASGADAGTAIASGAKAFRDSVKTTQQNLYAKLDTHIPAETRITSDRTQAALADLNTDIAGAPELSKWFKNARIQGIEGGLKSDTGSIEAVLSRPGMKDQVANMQGQLESQAAQIRAANAERRTLGMSNLEPEITPAQIQEQINGFLEKQVDSRLPYESIKKLRTLVGRELSDTSLASDVPRSKWRALYGALSDDLGDAAKAAGPKAEQVWSRANQYTKAAMERMDHLDTIVNRDTPEKVFKAATAGIADGGTNIRRIMRSMPLDNRREVTAAVLQRLGKARNGLQNEAGDVFSSESFLTNLNAISPAARTALFDSSGIPGLGEKIAQMGRMSAVRREGSAVFANPSGTARQVGLSVWISSLLSAIGSGQPAAIAGALALPVTTNGLARLATHPDVVKFAAKSTALPEGMKAVAIGEAARAIENHQDQPSPYVELRGMADKPMNRIQAGNRAFKNGGVVEAVPGGYAVRQHPAPESHPDPAHAAATSPHNDHPEPTDAQKQAGNYRVGRIKVGGMDISVENPEGSTRRGTDADGTPWETQMQGAHYGYLRGTRANDGDKLDVFVKPGTPEDHKGPVYVVDQVDPKTGRFDEHKSVIGATDAKDAEAIYRSNYAADWQGLGAITKLPMIAFRAWARSGKLNKPLGDLPDSDANG